LPTVGEILFAVRSKIPDMPPTLPAPSAPGNIPVAQISALGPDISPNIIITTINNYTPTIGSSVSYIAGSDPTFNNAYTVANIISGNQFSCVGPHHTEGTSIGGTLGVSAIVTTYTGSSTLPVGTYYAVTTQRNPWGETLSSEEDGPITIGAGQGLTVTSPLLPGATTIRTYLTLANGASGSEIQYVESTTSPFNITAPPTGFGTPPTRSTAYLMDSDGPQFGTSTIYQWLNEAINKLARAVGGLQDYSGVPTAAGQPLYVLPGMWGEISDVWYGGYWVQGGKRAEFFRRNTITSSVLSKATISVMSDKQVIEVYPQPDRNAGVTTTSAAMAAGDTAVAVANPGVFYLPFGFCQIGTEICAYATTALTGLIRGLGSTTAQAWPEGTTVTELSLFWCGKRLVIPPYQPGQSLMNLSAPQGWVAILPNYVLAQAKKAELDLEAAKSLEDTFFKEAAEWMLANKPVPRFIQVGGGRGTLAFDVVLDNGVIVP
jgi:hypothetical protein